MDKAPEIKYNSWNVPKKNGGYRRITAPNQELKLFQNKIKKDLDLLPIHPAVHGFVHGRNIMTNASAHLNKDYVLNIDIKNFFPSIKTTKTIEILKNHYRLKPSLLEEIEKFCFLNGGLPQGAPTSPVLANLFMCEMDLIFSHFAKDYGLSYTRYADDVTFSGSSFLKEGLSQVLSFLDGNLSWYGLLRNFRKTKLMPYYQRQLVTGLLVNNHEISIPRKKRDELYFRFKGTKEEDLTVSDKGVLEFVRSVNIRVYNKIMGTIDHGKI